MSKKPNKKAKRLKSRINKYIENLCQLTDDAARSKAVMDFLVCCSKFHKYSFNNQFLIRIQSPDATTVAGFRAWNKHNRFVRRGEQGIGILAPLVYKLDPDDKNSPTEVKGFRIVYVFDVSQTDGEPLPEPPNWKSTEMRAELQERLIRFAEEQGIKVGIETFDDDETQGASRGGVITLAADTGTKTLIHEIAHEVLHRKSARFKMDGETMELEAEAIAYVVASHFGFEDESSQNYLALWHADAKKIAARADRIRQVSSVIITTLDYEGDNHDGNNNNQQQR